MGLYSTPNTLRWYDHVHYETHNVSFRSLIWQQVVRLMGFQKQQVDDMQFASTLAFSLLLEGSWNVYFSFLTMLMSWAFMFHVLIVTCRRNPTSFTLGQMSDHLSWMTDCLSRIDSKSCRGFFLIGPGVGCLYWDETSSTQELTLRPLVA